MMLNDVQVEIGSTQNANSLASYYYKGDVNLVLPSTESPYNIVYDLLVGILGISKELYTKYMKSVLERKETGVFYPKFDISIYPPVFFLSTKSENGFDRIKLHTIFSDCLDANEKYLKKKNMLLVVPKDLNISLSQVKNVIEEIATDYFKNGPKSQEGLIFCQKIIVCN